MNITSPILTGAANAAELPGYSVTSFLRAIGFSDSPDGGLGIIMSALAGIAARWRLRSCCRSISAAATAAGAT